MSTTPVSTVRIEPGLAFVKKACDYYHVSADYLLGRTLDRDGGMIDAESLYDSSSPFPAAAGQGCGKSQHSWS